MCVCVKEVPERAKKYNKGCKTQPTEFSICTHRPTGAHTIFYTPIQSPLSLGEMECPCELVSLSSSYGLYSMRSVPTIRLVFNFRPPG